MKKTKRNGRAGDKYAAGAKSMITNAIIPRIAE
jgi:hypothetical protein